MTREAIKVASEHGLSPKRPAEATTGVAGVVYLLATIFGVDSVEAQSAMIATLTILPGAVSLLVDAGGIRGAFNLVWHGREAE